MPRAPQLTLHAESHENPSAPSVSFVTPRRNLSEYRTSVRTMDLAAAVAAYTVGVDALLAADVDSASHRELVTAYADIEIAARRTPVVGYGILARLEREADPKSLGATSLWKLVVLR